MLVSRPEGSSERGVTNSIQVISNVPDRAALVARRPAWHHGASTGTPRCDFTFRGMDAGYNPVPLAAGQVGWSVTAPIGTIDAAGHFVATAPGSGQVIATANGVTGSAPITVLDDTTAPVAAPPRVSLPVNGAIGTGSHGRRSTGMPPRTAGRAPCPTSSSGA